MAISTAHNEAIRQLAEALGIPLHFTVGFTLRVRVNEAVTVEIEQYVEDRGAHALTTKLKQYRLTPVAPQPQEGKQA